MYKSILHSDFGHIVIDYVVLFVISMQGGFFKPLGSNKKTLEFCHYNDDF
jgi:hypothetical protein